MSDANKKENELVDKMKGIKTDTLTLNPDEQKINFSFTEPSLSEMDFFQENSEKESAGAVDEAMLSEEEKRKIEEFVKQINVADIKMVNSYGANAQRKISTFSSSVTEMVTTKELGDVGDCLRELKVAISSTTVIEKKGILGFFQKGKQKATYIISNYESAETNIKKIEKDLQRHQQILTKDIYIYDQMYDMNLEFYKELTMYIIAGKKALKEARNTKLKDLKIKAESTQDQLVIQLYRDYDDACKRFEKRISDLETTRLVSIQMAPQIRLLQNAEQEEVDKLRSDIINTIPLWRNQMVLALGIDHSRRALDAQSAITEMTNEMFRYNAETLKQGAIDAALASEKAIIDIETLKKVNADIVTSINEVVKIHEEGSKRRNEAQAELAKMEVDLKKALIEAGS